MQSIKYSFGDFPPPPKSPKMAVLRIADISGTIWPQKIHRHLHQWVMIPLAFGV